MADFFPSATTCGRIFNDYLYRTGSFHQKYKSQAKAVNALQVPAGTRAEGMQLVLQKDFFGNPKEMLMVIDKINGSYNHRSIGYISSETRELEMMVDFIGQKDELGVFSVEYPKPGHLIAQWDCQSYWGEGNLNKKLLWRLMSFQLDIQINLNKTFSITLTTFYI